MTASIRFQERWLRAVLCLVALCLTALIYWPGLSGGFLFDDFPNLEQIGARGPIESLELLQAYLSSGSAGPTGRPLSLISFLIDANDWPADPWLFKRTNLVLHLLTGLLLYATTFRLLEAMGRATRDAAWIALLAATLWLVNPFFVSTTLYAVQRMTQLAALFVLAGLWCFLYGRQLLGSRPRRGYLVLSTAIPVFTALALMSKENGALLPLLVLVVHLSLNASGAGPRPSRLWVTVFLGLPSAAIVAYLLSRVPLGDAAFVSRDFTLYERLLSQPRFFWDYLLHLIVPHIQTQGLYQDGRTASTGLLEPWTTLPALIGFVALSGIAWLARRKRPLLFLAVFFFIAGHLLESTTIPLELYFEHRNYLPAALLFLPAAALLYDSTREAARPALLLASTGLLLVGCYSLATWQRATLWGDTDQLLLVWAETNPDSARAQVSAAQIWLKLDQGDRALEILDAASASMPDSALLVVNGLAFRAELGRLSLEELRQYARRLREIPFDPQGLMSLELLVGIVNARAPVPAHAEIVDELLSGIRSDLNGTLPAVHRMTIYLQGLLWAGQGDIETAMPYLRDAVALFGSVDSGLRIVSDLAIMGHYDEALEVLSQAEALFDETGAANGHFSESRYRSEIERLRSELIKDSTASIVVDAAI